MNIWFDNLQVVVIPEPSTVALGLLGGLALTVLVLRQRRK
ncbi:MAG: PEP-CTERM sorting domain-containing protein [Verrucomicrobia bacterium]|nr:PEP-CTERM sorting domain-containing protein [Verrucomicrobiota bacterium]